MRKLKGNKALDRDYFRYKYRPKKQDEKHVTDCCGQGTERHILNANDEDDWLLIEDYIETRLREYSSTESITPIVCEKCGRLKEYISSLKFNRKLPGD